ADIGKLERFMQRALENIIIAYDGSVRDSRGFLYSTSYNNGFNIAKTLAIGTVDKPNLSNFIDVNIIIDRLNHALGWYSTSELKKTNIEPKKQIKSLEDEFTALLNEEGNVEIEPIAIESKNQNISNKLTIYEKARI